MASCQSRVPAVAKFRRLRQNSLDDHPFFAIMANFNHFQRLAVFDNRDVLPLRGRKIGNDVFLHFAD